MTRDGVDRNRSRGSRANKVFRPKKVAVIGCGWFGIDAAIELKKAGHQVVMYEKNQEILSEVSGNFGIRTHTHGFHYPRSTKSRKICRETYPLFKEKYPNLLLKTSRSIHALVESDSKGAPPKVDYETFVAMTKEDPSSEILDVQKHGFQGFQYAVENDEPAIVVGNRLRDELRAELVKHNIPFFCDFSVQRILKGDDKFVVLGMGEEAEFDEVINATGFRSFIPEGFKDNPFSIEPVFQPCLGLIYEDLNPTDPDPFMLLALDGANPAMMPYGGNKYVVTHAIHTILASCPTQGEAVRVLGRATSEFVSGTVKRLTEEDVVRYYPNFLNRFRYLGFKGSVLAKPLTATEFRCAFAFGDPDGIKHIFPGKVTNVVHTSAEIVDLVSNPMNCRIYKRYSYTHDGVLAQARDELKDKPKGTTHNTCLSNPYPELLDISNQQVLSSSSLSIFSGQRRERSGSIDSLPDKFRVVRFG
jgi:hypothetical protein